MQNQLGSASRMHFDGWKRYEPELGPAYIAQGFFYGGGETYRAAPKSSGHIGGATEAACRGTKHRRIDLRGVIRLVCLAMACEGDRRSKQIRSSKHARRFEAPAGKKTCGDR